MKSRIAILILVLSSFVLPDVWADGYYVIELEGVHWYDPGRIPVRIDTKNQTLYQLSMDAVQIWNKAQEWYRDNYDKGGIVHKFTIVGPSEDPWPQTDGILHPIFIDFGTPYSYIDIPYGGRFPVPCYCVGIAYVYGYPFQLGFDHIDKVEITVDSSYSAPGIPWKVSVLGTIMHELGHALGLGHAAERYDLMYDSIDYGQLPGGSIVYPSTLDLYALQVLTRLVGFSKDPEKAVLPEEIPYQVFPVKRELQVNVPDQIAVTIDSVKYPAGNVQVTLVTGTHTIEVPATFKIDDGTRLKFGNWLGTDSTLAAASSEDPQLLTLLVIEDNITLRAVYTTQYRFTIKGFADNIVYESWYDSGSTTKFVQPDKVEKTIPMNGLLGALGGVWKLQGWLDNGQPISPNNGITINEPHTLTPRYSPDYTIPFAVIVAVAGASVAVILRRRKKQKAVLCLL